MSGSQPSPSRATPGFRHGENGLVKPRSWPPSGTHPPPGGVVPFQTDRRILCSMVWLEYNRGGRRAASQTKLASAWCRLPVVKPHRFFVGDEL